MHATTRVNNNHQKLLECVTLEGVREHQAAFQAIADANGGTRASGTPGYEDSVDYVVERMEAAGYNVTLHSFPFVFVPPPTLQQLTPVDATYETGAFSGSGFGDVTAASSRSTSTWSRRAPTPAAATAPTRRPPSAPPILADPGRRTTSPGSPAGRSPSSSAAAAASP